MTIPIENHPMSKWRVPKADYLREWKADYKRVRISPSHEPLETINHGLECKSYYWHYKPRPEGALEAISVRGNVANALYRMEQELKPYGLRLLILEGYRPLAVQRFAEQYAVLKVLRKENPNCTEEELRKMATQFVASADSDLNLAPPPHLTGGAVDLTLIHADGPLKGMPVPMGKELGMLKAYPDALEAPEYETHPARKYRRVLYWLATEHGFATNPTEWWHLSHGDQMWAWVTNSPYAFYGAVQIGADS